MSLVQIKAGAYDYPSPEWDTVTPEVGTKFFRFFFFLYCWQNILVGGKLIYMRNCKTLIYSGMVSPRWEAQIKFPFDNLIVCITRIKKELVSSWANLFSPEILSSAPFLPIYDPIIEKCTTTHLSGCKNGWISISGESTQVGERERRGHRCIYYFSIQLKSMIFMLTFKMVVLASTLASTLMIYSCRQRTWSTRCLQWILPRGFVQRRYYYFSHFFVFSQQSSED